MDKVDLDNIKTYKKCNDGHRVLSLSEQIIDNWLNEKQIRHYYDIEIDNSTAWRYDFFLPDYNIFIEFWGLETEKYHARKKAKLEYYKENDYKLISIENTHLSDINGFLRKKLENLGVFKKQKNK